MKKGPLKKKLILISITFLFAVILNSSFFQLLPVVSKDAIIKSYKKEGIFVFSNYAIINKLSYQFKIPFSRFFKEGGYTLVKISKPKRGEVILFEDKTCPAGQSISIVAGVEDDKIELNEKAIIINGKFYRDIGSESYKQYPFYKNKIFIVPKEKFFVLGPMPGRYESLYIDYVDYNSVLGKSILP